MGQWWSGESESEIARAEMALYLHAGIPKEDLEISKVPIYEHLNDPDYYIH